MWLMTKHGFYSIVQKADGYHIRAREREDLLLLLDGLACEAVDVVEDGKVIGIREGRHDREFGIIETPDHDYRYRIIVGRARLEQVMAWLARTCDYPNFKAQIDSDPAQKRKPYHEIWGILARAPGSYGRDGK